MRQAIDIFAMIIIGIFIALYIVLPFLVWYIQRGPEDLRIEHRPDSLRVNYRMGFEHEPY